MSESGKRLRDVMTDLIHYIKPGISTDAIDKKAEFLIKKNNAEPSFKRVEGYSWSTCLPINEQIVHTPPSSRILTDSDILTVDIGVFYMGYNTDYAITFPVQKSTIQTDIFLSTGKKTLTKAISEVRLGNHIGDVSQVIQKKIEHAGYSIVPELTGHGIGKELHEDPFVPCFLDQQIKKTIKMQVGLVLAIEVIYAMGKGKIKNEKGSDWSLITADKSLSACFEHTVAITDKGTVILT